MQQVQEDPPLLRDALSVGKSLAAQQLAEQSIKARVVFAYYRCVQLARELHDAGPFGMPSQSLRSMHRQASVARLARSDSEEVSGVQTLGQAARSKPCVG